MALTPEDIEEKTFSTALRGYDLDEVDDFLDQVVTSMREMRDRLQETQAAPPTSPEPEVEDSAVGRALIAAQATADRILAEAGEEAERILAEARSAAETLETDRDERKEAARAEMAELEASVSEVRAKLAVLAKQIADRLDDMDAAMTEVSHQAEEPIEELIQHVIQHPIREAELVDEEPGADEVETAPDEETTAGL